jgi:hypothetical protein
MSETATLTGIELVQSIEAQLKDAMSTGNMTLVIDLSGQLTKARKGAADELAKKADDTFITMGVELLDTPVNDLAGQFEDASIVTISDIVLDFFERAEELVGDKADFALRFSRDFVKPYVGFAKIKASRPKSVGEAHQKDETGNKVSSTDLLKIVGDTILTQEMAGSKYIKDFIGLPFNEASERIAELQKQGVIKDGNPRYQLKLAMQRIAS